MVMATVISLPIMLVKPSLVAVFATTTMGIIGTVIIPMADIDITSTNLVASGIPAAGITKVTADISEVTVEDITADEKTHHATPSINNFPLGVSPRLSHREEFTPHPLPGKKPDSGSNNQSQRQTKNNSHLGKRANTLLRIFALAYHYALI